MSYNAGKFYSSIHHDKIVGGIAVVRFSLHKHITVADFTSLFFFDFYYNCTTIMFAAAAAVSAIDVVVVVVVGVCLVSFLFSCACGCSLVSMLRYLSI